MELYKKYRPAKPSELVGQTSVVSALKSYFKNDTLPHCVLITGGSGCGKTSIARMIRNKLGCTSELDYAEINCANFRGIDMVRDISLRMNYAPQSGTARVWIIDEAHQLSRDAQNAFLKILEDTPTHVYFFLCTTDPAKLIPTVRNRATSLQVKPLNRADANELVSRVADKEDITLSEEVVEQLIEVGEGSPRRLLVLLEQISQLPDEDEQLQCLAREAENHEAIEICRIFMQPKPNWKALTVVLKSITEEPESIRWMVLSYFTTILLNNHKMGQRAAIVLDRFASNFYDTKKAGLVLACHEVCELCK